MHKLSEYNAALITVRWRKKVISLYMILKYFEKQNDK